MPQKKCAAKAKELEKKLAKEAKDRQRLSKGRGQKGPVNCTDLKEKGDTRDKLGEQFGVSGSSVERASMVIERGIPELAAAIEKNRLARDACGEPSADEQLGASFRRLARLMRQELGATLIFHQAKGRHRVTLGRFDTHGRASQRTAQGDLDDVIAALAPPAALPNWEQGHDAVTCCERSV